MKKKIGLIVSILIGCAFLYLGFSEMWQKHQAEQQAEALFSETQENFGASVSNGLDNL